MPERYPLEVRRLTGASLGAAIPKIAALRIEVFRDWPYLYDGDLAYEESYLAPYRDNSDAVLVGAFADGTLVGAATAMPLQAHADSFAAAFADSKYDPKNLFYCAESVLLPQYRGQGAGHAFFDLRESAAREQGFAHVTFCAVVRPPVHPACPDNYRPLDTFWRARGYRPLSGVTANFDWKDIGEQFESTKCLPFWLRDL